MIGGLMKSTSSLALTIAAGLVLSTNAFAADLGGNCCADLEERVAELEATTARKGNRKVSLTISGQVNRTIMYWNDGGRSNTYFGLDNTNSSSRFNLSGNATINSEWKAGFNLTIDVADNARSVSVSQAREDGTSLRGGAAGTTSATNPNADHLLRLRDANFWLESARLGRVTMGRLTTSGATGTLDLGGVGVVASAGEGCIGTSMRFRDGAGALTANAIGTYSMGCAHPVTRNEGIKYTSPTFSGFTFNASIAEAAKVETSDNPATVLAPAGPGQGPIGQNVGFDLRYAGEFNGLRIASSIGYSKSDRNEDDGVSTNSIYTELGYALSLFHVPTGLFAQGEYIDATGKSVDNAVNGFAADPTAKGNRWHIQGGVKRNWFGIGDTSLYAEFGQHKGWKGLQAANVLSVPGTVAGTSADKLDIWGLGVVQNVDAAAMELYLGYRNYKASDPTVAAGLQSIDIIAAGARIKF
jgi:Gram-negative porin